MAKGKKRGRSVQPAHWTASDHGARLEDKQTKTQKKQKNRGGISTSSRRPREDRTAHLTHNTREKRDLMKLQLHMTQTQRAVTALRHRLVHWDPVAEAAVAQQQQQKRDAEKDAAKNNNGNNLDEATEATKKKKKGRKGPESWKLRGAARPAWEVYDFDVRHVDPHIKAHQDAAARTQRSLNLLTLYKGRFALQQDPGQPQQQESPPPPSPDSTTNTINTTITRRVVDSVAHTHQIAAAREYLRLLMQLGYLHQEAKQYKSARNAWLECVELEGDSTATAVITSARESLMRMYVELQRYDAAYRLGDRWRTTTTSATAPITTPSTSYSTVDDSSIWIRYSMALVACMHNNNKNNVSAEQEMSPEQLDEIMIQAVQCNIFAAYYLCHYKTFAQVVEYTEDLQQQQYLSEDDDDEAPQSSLLLEALDYCTSPHGGVLWQTTAGAIEALQRVMMMMPCNRTSSSQARRQLLPSDLEWSERLSQMEVQFLTNKSQSSSSQVTARRNERITTIHSETDPECDSRKDDKGEEDEEDSNAGGDDNKKNNNNQVDLTMFAGMFRTAMEMLIDSGAIQDNNLQALIE